MILNYSLSPTSVVPTNYIAYCAHVWRKTTLFSRFAPSLTDKGRVIPLMIWDGDKLSHYHILHDCPQWRQPMTTAIRDHSSLWDTPTHICRNAKNAQKFTNANLSGNVRRWSTTTSDYESRIPRDDGPRRRLNTKYTFHATMVHDDVNLQNTHYVLRWAAKILNYETRITRNDGSRRH